MAELARERGCHSLIAKIAAEMTPSIALHKSVGFEEVGRLREAGLDSIPGGGAGWLGVEQKDGYLDASILWGGGSVVPVDSVFIVESNSGGRETVPLESTVAEEVIVFASYLDASGPTYEPLARAPLCG